MAAVALPSFLAALGCSSPPPPPYAELTLRDALGADPSVIASLSDSQRARIADKFEQERDAEGDRDADLGAPEVVPLSSPSTPQEVLRAMDDGRRADGRDALVAAALEPRNGTLVVEPLGARSTATTTALPPLEGEAATDTAAAENLALEGRAGRIVAETLASSGAKRLVRVTQWPTAIAAVGDVVYVNGAWLVVMSSLEARDGGSSSRPVVLGAGIVPALTLTPQSLQGSPFATYPTLAACVADVTAQCQACLSGGACSATPELSDFGSYSAECQFLEGDGGSPQAIQELCVMALTSIATVAQCVEDDGCVPPPSNDNTSAGLASAASFLTNDTCVRSLNLCLSGQNAPVAGGSTDINVNAQGCLGPIDACTSAFKELGDACSSGKCSGQSGQGPSCTSCNGCATCSSCNSNTRTGTGTGYGSTGTGQNPNQGGSGSSGSGSGSGGSSGTGGSGGSSGSASGSGGGSGSSGSGSGSSGGSGSSASGSSGGSGSSGTGNTSSGSGGSNGCSGGCTGGGSSGGSSNSCSACNGGSSSSSGGSGGSGSSSSNSSCQGCGSSGSSGGGGSGGSGGGGGSSNGNCNNKCEVASDTGVPEPPLSIVAMGLPVLYLGRRARRRRSSRRQP